MSSDFQLVNYYDKCENDRKEMYDYPNKSAINLNLPMRALVLGPSGSGKSNLALNLIPAIGIWDKIVLLAKELNQPLFAHLRKKIAKIEKAQKRRILLEIDNIGDLPPLSAFDPKENTLLIVDDFVADDPKSLIPLNEIWMRGRNRSISPVFLSQSYFDTPKMIRKNSDMVFIKELGNPKDLGRITAEYALGSTAKEIQAKYNQVIGGQDMKQFFLIDRFNKDPSMRFRNGFKAID